MRPGFSARFLNACYLANSNEILTTLIEIHHPQLVTPLRFHNKIKPLTSNGNLYDSRMFTMALPNNINDQLPQVTLTIDNTDYYLSLSTYLLDTQSPYDVYMSIIKKSQPNVVEFGPNKFTCLQLSCDEDHAVFACTLDQGLEKMWPKDAFTPHSHPAIFA